AEFIRRELRECWGQKGWQLRSQLAHRALLRNENHRRLFWLKPDIRFETAGGLTDLIVDTKYKLLDPSAAKCGVAESDAYQMFAYARRYECPRVVLLYPQNDEEVVRRWGSDETGSAWLEARTLNLKCDFSKRADRDGLREALVTILTNAKL